MKHCNFVSNRLEMQLVQKEHAEKIWPVLQDASLYKYLPKHPPTLMELERQYTFWENHDSPDKKEYWLNWVVFLRTKKSPIGTIQIGIHKQKKEGTVAYLIGADFQGMG